MENILGKRIELERTKLGLSQVALAKALNLSSSASISQYERGERIPADDIKLKMCEMFNCSLDYLVGKSDLKNNLTFSFQKDAEGLSDEEISDALKLYKELKNRMFKDRKIS